MRVRIVHVSLIAVFALCGVVLSLSSCSPMYVLQAAYEEGKILAGRRDIEATLADPQTSDFERQQLELVQSARLFAIDIGLTPRNSFTKYTKIEKDVLTWVLVGSRPDEFALKTWWFPFAGTLPYKGFFDQEEAHRAATELSQEGYETWVRGSDAFSTLGWFNDPILTPALKQPPVNLVNTVIHEILHSTIWIQDNVAFNESLANFVGITGALEFFERERERCSGPSDKCAQVAKLAEQARTLKQRELHIGTKVQQLYHRLNALYQSKIPKDQKLSERIVIFEEETGELRRSYPELKALTSINNAEIVQLILYLTDLPRFQLQYEVCDMKWECFFEKMRTLAARVDNSSAPIDPFSELPRIP